MEAVVSTSGGAKWKTIGGQGWQLHFHRRGVVTGLGSAPEHQTVEEARASDRELRDNDQGQSQVT